MRTATRTLIVFALALLITAAGLFATIPSARAHGDGWRENDYSRWTCLSHYESTHRWSYNGPSGYDGGLQFHPTTWRQYTGSSAPDYAWQASREFQIKVAKRVAWYGFYKHEPQGMGAWGAWDECR